MHEETRNLNFLSVKPVLETSLLIPLRSDTMSPKRKELYPIIPKKLPDFDHHLQKTQEMAQRLNTTLPTTRRKTHRIELNDSHETSFYIERSLARPSTIGTSLIVTTKDQISLAQGKVKNFYDFRPSDKFTLESPDQSPSASTKPRTAFSFRDSENFFKTGISDLAFEISEKQSLPPSMNRIYIDQISEMIETKHKLASRNIPSTYRKLETALLGKDLVFNPIIDPHLLPKGNERLLKAPGLKSDKPKKKGKKKRKKKAKN